MSKSIKILLICILIGAFSGLGLGLFDKFVFELPIWVSAGITGFFAAIGFSMIEKLEKAKAE